MTAIRDRVLISITKREAEALGHAYDIFNADCGDSASPEYKEDLKAVMRVLAKIEKNQIWSKE